MSANSLQTFWLPLLALLAVEVGVIAGLVEVFQRWSSSAGWRRTFCQAGLLAVLALSVGELSGAARFVAGWVVGAASREPTGRLALETSAARGNGAGWDGMHGSEGNYGLATNRTRGSAAGVWPEASAGKPNELSLGPPGPQLAGVPTAEGRVSNVEGRRLIPSTLHAPHSTLHARPSSPPARLPAGFWVVLAWGTGALVVGGRVCFARCVFVLFRLRRRETADRALVERMKRMARTLGLRRRVRLMVSARLTGPIAFGWIWPSVALPSDFAAGLDGIKQDAVLLHELAHLAAHDSFWSLLADAATVVLWWHPAVWRLRRQLQLANELAADEASLLVADGPRVLAECLVQFGARLLERPVAGQIPVTGFRSHLGRRVQQLMRLEGRTWSPPRRLPAALARSFGAGATAAAVVLCTAWATPRELTKGDSMKTIQQNWKQSLAAFAFLAAINGPDAVGRQAQSQPTTPAPVASAAPAAPTPGAAKVFDLTNADAQQILQDLFERSGNTRSSNHSRLMLSTANPLIEGAIQNTTPAAVSGVLAASAVVPVSTNRIEAKLKSIVLDEVKPMENLPLSEVVKILIDRARKGDPEGIGVNFLMDFKQPSTPGRGAGVVDPATGLPVAGAPVETVDLNSVGIRIPFPLHNITLWDMLNIMLKASDMPIQYTVEEYGVLFSLKPQTSTPEPKPVPAAAPERLIVRTFKVDTNTVVAALRDTFQIWPPGADVREAAANGLRELIRKVGVIREPDSFFYNGQTGVLMVRASREDMEVISAAMETLTGLEQKRDPLQPEAGTGARQQKTDVTLSLITEQFKQQEQEVKKQQERLQNFLATNNVVFLQEQGSSAGAYAAKLSKQLASLRTEMKLLELITPEQLTQAGTSRVAPDDDSPAGQGAANELMKTLAGPQADFFRASQQIQLLRAKREELLQSLRPSHPKILKLDEDIAEQEKIVEVFKRQSLAQMANRREALALQIANLEASAAEWEQKALDASRKMADYQRIQDDVKRAQALYEKLLGAIQQVDVNRAPQQSGRGKPTSSAR